MAPHKRLPCMLRRLVAPAERVSRQPLQLALRVRVTGAQNFSRQGWGMNIEY
ncbi:MAG: hypothetical protein ACHBN1_21325 [Heteroscytonema crispum UTEX LB 1556]